MDGPWNRNSCGALLTRGMRIRPAKGNGYRSTSEASATHPAAPEDPALPVRCVAPLGGRSEATGGPITPPEDPALPVRWVAPLGGRSEATGGPITPRAQA